MTTTIDYALMAGASYLSTRPLVNQFPVPQGWTAFFPVPDPTTALAFPVTAGFEAISFTNGTEIVISFAGTYPKNPDGSAMPIPIDLQADIDLAAGASNGSKGYAQLLQAAEYYLDVKRQNPGGKSMGSDSIDFRHMVINDFDFSFSSPVRRRVAQAGHQMKQLVELLAIPLSNRNTVAK